jgi:hypothetical protein
MYGPAVRRKRLSYRRFRAGGAWTLIQIWSSPPQAATAIAEDAPLDEALTLGNAR